jgi:hemerythrin
MAIEWTPQLSTGLDWQDAEHKELFARIDQLLEAMHHNEAGSNLEGLFSFLDCYVVQHFGHEEIEMRKSGYPGLTAHLNQHIVFMARLVEYKTAFERQGGSSYVIMHLQRWLADFLLKHVPFVDKAMAAYILNQIEA